MNENQKADIPCPLDELVKWVFIGKGKKAHAWNRPPRAMFIWCGISDLDMMDAPMDAPRCIKCQRKMDDNFIT